MIAKILGHTPRGGYFVGIVYAAEEIVELLETGVEDTREKFLGNDKQRAEKFCRRWNAHHGNGKDLDLY